ncbi:uncharacterized protein LOC122499603 [Leptopilina heterotoma]|uniref:uncharacterized protein LOC122499603 n=1 Tax=Leptopilina heterotoma TaxID=63436 RepID=UPI001CA7FBDD|nr:uncharacterized protein LOC122499603 [Leptopilina heterotoma]
MLKMNCKNLKTHLQQIKKERDENSINSEAQNESSKSNLFVNSKSPVPATHRSKSILQTHDCTSKNLAVSTHNSLNRNSNIEKKQNCNPVVLPQKGEEAQIAVDSLYMEQVNPIITDSGRDALVTHSEKPRNDIEINSQEVFDVFQSSEDKSLHEKLDSNLGDSLKKNKLFVHCFRRRFGYKI